MSMSTVSYKNVLNRAYNVLNQVKLHTEEINENGRKRIVYFVDEIKDAMIECAKEIGRLEVFISQHQNPTKYVAVKEELEVVQQKLSQLL